MNTKITGINSYKDHNHTYGIDYKNKNVNVKSGLTISKKENGPFISNSITLNSGSFTYSGKNYKANLSAPKVNVTGNATIGGFGYGGSAKASLTEVSGEYSKKIFDTNISIKAEAGIGVAAGGKVGVTSNSFNVGLKLPITPGIYGGVSIDISK